MPPISEFAEVGTPCGRATNLINCGVGVDYTAPGTWQCKDGELECLATAGGVHYCNSPNRFDGCGDGYPAGCPNNYATTVLCTGDDDCAPGFYCREIIGPTSEGAYCAACNDEGNYPSCWAPGADGGCNGGGTLFPPSCES